MLVVAAMSALTVTFAAVIDDGIIQVAIPEDSMDSICRPVLDDVWTATGPPYPIDVTVGIGNLINPDVVGGQSDFSLHDHVYVEPFVPEPSRAVVTYAFNKPTIVRYIDIVQHVNGIDTIECFYGNDSDNLQSLGSTIAPDAYGELSTSTFDLENTTHSGTFFRFVVRTTHLDNGWASYRAFLRDASGDPIGLGIGCTADCDNNGQLNILDFVCYQGLFQAGDMAADCDSNGQLNILDFVCFQGAFQAGCP